MIKKRYIFYFFLLVTGFQLLGRTAGDSDKMVVHSLDIEGNVYFREEALKQLMVCRPGWLWQHRYYRPELFAMDLENVQKYYRQHGFLEIRISNYSANIDSVNHTVDLTVQLQEGKQTYIEGIHLFGNEAFADSLLESKLKVRTGHPLIVREIDQSQNNLLQFYADHGFLDAQVTVDIKTNPESHRTILDFSISEHEISRLRRILLKGIQKTKPTVLLREIAVDSGDVIRYSQLLKSQRKLYLTGLFQYAYIRPAPIDSAFQGQRDIAVEVQENQYGEFNTSFGYGSEDKLRVRSEIAHKNVHGTARGVGFQCWLSFIRRGLMISATDPWLFHQPVKADANLVTEYKEEPGYHSLRSGGQAIFGRSLGQFSVVHFTLRQDFTRFSHVKTLPDEKAKANLSSLKWSVNYDTRNNLFDTQQGLYTSFSYELARAVFDEPLLFHRYEADVRMFGSFWQMVIGSGVEFGWMTSRVSIRSIPLNERYYVGGQGSVRGFDYKKLGPLNPDGVPTGGLVRMVWHVTEMRYPLYRSLKGAFFLDAGNCWDSIKSMQNSSLRTAFGAGLRLHSFLGIVRVDYAHKLDRLPGEKPGAWVFNMGHSF